MTAGSIVFFNGYLLHRSLPNLAASGYRRALVNHYMSAESLLPWRFDGTGARGVASADFRDIVMIAGRDPYAWKGIEDVSFSHIRPDREGGCQWPTKEEGVECAQLSDACAKAMGQEVSGMKFTAVFKEVPEGYIGFVEELPGANT